MKKDEIEEEPKELKKDLDFNKSKNNKDKQESEEYIFADDNIKKDKIKNENYEPIKGNIKELPNKDLGNIFDNLLNDDEDDDKQFEDLKSILNKDRKEKKDNNQIEQDNNKVDDKINNNSEKLKNIKPKLIRTIDKVNSKTKIYYLKIYFYKWKEIIKNIPKKDENKLPPLEEIEKHNKEKNNLEKEIIGKKEKLKGKKNKSKNITLLLDQEEPVNRIIIQDDREILEPKEKGRLLLKKIIKKRILKPVLYQWFENTQKLKIEKRVNSRLNGIYGYCYTEQYTYESYEYAIIHANIESKEINNTINPLFSKFLRKMNLSVAAFNLFNFYSQLHDIKSMCKRKYLSYWRKISKLESSKSI